MIKKILIILLSIGIAFYTTRAMAENISIFSAIDKKEITIGDKITLVIKIFRTDKDKKISFPNKISTGDFELKDFKVYKDQVLDDGRILSRIDYILSIYKTGKFKIPVIDMINGLKTEEFEINVKSVIKEDIEKVKDIKEIKSLMDLKADILKILLYCLVFLLLIASGVFGCLYYKKIKNKKNISIQEEKKYEEEIAFESLEKLFNENLIQKREYKQYFLRLSNIIKAYLEARYKILAVEYTSTEILLALKELKIGSGNFNLVKEFLNGSDLVKFAKWIPEDKYCEDAFLNAKQIVELTRKNRVAQEGDPYVYQNSMEKQ